MARKVSSTDVLPTRANPDLFGEDLQPLVWEALGVGLASFGNDQLVSPLARQFVPGVGSSPITAKLSDALSTAGTGWAAGELIGMVSRPIGNRIRRGGVLLGVAKAIGAFLPGYSLSATFPAIPLPAIGAPAAKSNVTPISAAPSAAAQVPSGAVAGKRVMGI